MPSPIWQVDAPEKHAGATDINKANVNANPQSTHVPLLRIPVTGSGWLDMLRERHIMAYHPG
jgi:hypothetical protein